MSIRRLKRDRWISAAMSLALASPYPVQACQGYEAPQLQEAQNADAVVIGRIYNYRIIRNDYFRKRELARNNLTQQKRKMYMDPKRILGADYARFDVQVEKTISGKAAKTITVTQIIARNFKQDPKWTRRYLMALYRPFPVSTPTAGKNPERLIDPRFTTWYIPQPPCSAALMFDSESEDAKAIRKLLAK